MPIKVYALGALNAATDFLDASASLSGQVAFQIYGTFVGTITFEGYLEGATSANLIALQATDLNAGTAATTATGPGIFRINVSPTIRVRARMSAYTSGTANVAPAASLG